jgi:hypothetical protein
LTPAACKMQHTAATNPALITRRSNHATIKAAAVSHLRAVQGPLLPPPPPQHSKLPYL